MTLQQWFTKLATTEQYAMVSRFHKLLLYLSLLRLNPNFFPDSLASAAPAPCLTATQVGLHTGAPKRTAYNSNNSLKSRHRIASMPAHVHSSGPKCEVSASNLLVIARC